MIEEVDDIGEGGHAGDGGNVLVINGTRTGGSLTSSSGHLCGLDKGSTNVTRFRLGLIRVTWGDDMLANLFNDEAAERAGINDP